MPTLTRSIALALALLTAHAAHAGRPLMVEDAGVNDVGAGRVEAWFERAPGNARVWTVSPAYSPVTGLELAAALSRDAHERQTAARLQAKWQFVAPDDAHCGYAAVAGLTRQQGQSSLGPWLNGVLTCPLGPGTAHLNLGATREPRGHTQPVIGAAWEQDLGFATGHIETVATRHARPVFNLGLRREIARGLQLDGSLGRSAGQTLFSVGLKQQF